MLKSNLNRIESRLTRLQENTILRLKSNLNRIESTGYFFKDKKISELKSNLNRIESDGSGNLPRRHYFVKIEP